MNVESIEISSSPISPDRTCIRADVVYDDKALPPEVYWIDVPNTYAHYLSDSGNTWLALLLPLAVHRGEPLRISRPVDRELFMNVHGLMHIWNWWYPYLKPVPIEAEVQEQPSEQGTGATASLFSGGVDAWFTLLTHNADSNRRDPVRIDDLLCVWGLDIPLEDAGEFNLLKDALVRATSGLSTQFIEVGTNLRQTRWWAEADWGRVAHGSALASIGHAMSGRCRRLLIPSTHRFDDPIRWGSHPLTDPLLSSTLTKIIHDGAGFNRVQKTEALIKFEAALNSLQVCWESSRYRNCETCSKCYRTITTLYLLGALDRCSRFNTRRIDERKLARVFVRDDSSRAFLCEVRELAVRTHNFEIAQAIDRSLSRSRWLHLCLRLAMLPLRPAGVKYRRRLGWQIERILLRNSVL